MISQKDKKKKTFEESGRLPPSTGDPDLAACGRAVQWVEVDFAKGCEVTPESCRVAAALQRLCMQ